MKKIIVSFLVLILVASTLVGCGEKTPEANEASNPNNEEQQLEKIVVSELRSEFWLPVYLADELGYFKEEGLDVEFVTYKDGPLAFQGMHAGDSQFCMLSSEPVLRAYDQGKESKIILSTLTNKPYMFVTSPEIKSVKDLKGKVIFGGMPGSAPYSFVASILASEGLDPEADVTWANLEYGASLAALESGQIVGSYIRSTAKTEVAQMGGNILVDATIADSHKKLYGSDKYESTIVTVTKKYAEENPETVQKFTNAVVRAIIWQTENTDEEVARVATPVFPGKSYINAKLIEYLRSSLSVDGNISEEGHNTIIDFCLKEGLISSPIPYEDVIDTSFVKKSYQQFK
ncbi:ABC transporter substrate-binding protein [Alkaliphilus pronyensis]|uniref:ABC transporter substrate-binding protein n=1 Tax=Alkaliphilus pronyensis TaxID=1482732 RepID=UPI0018658544|nr:ABC transporter substrate-binding protein [Alkaliphilus pronyensis]